MPVKLQRLAILTLVLVLAASVTPLTAAAEPVIPRLIRSASARQAAASKAEQVQSIKTQLSDARADLDRTQIAVAKAGQDYDAALLRLDAARKSLATARAASAAAERDVASAKRAVGELVRGQVQGDRGLLQWASLLGGASPQDLLDEASVFNTVSASLDGLQRRLLRARQVAAERQQAATQAEAAQEAATADATAKKAAAEQAASVAQQTVSGYAARRDALLIQLAQAERVTVQLVRQRQAGLEAQARARAEAKRKAAEAALKRREAARPGRGGTGSGRGPSTGCGR